MTSKPQNSSNVGAWVIWGALIVPFMGMGIFLIGISTGFVHVRPGTVHAPLWVLACAGSVLVGCGSYALSLALQRGDDTRWVDLTLALVATGLATMAAWAAFGEGPRDFQIQLEGPFRGMEPSNDETLGRRMFAGGSIVSGAVACYLWRKFVRAIQRGAASR